MDLGHRHQMWRRKKKNAPETRAHYIRSIDIAAYTVSFMSMVATLDQARLVWIMHETAGVSFVTWAFYTVSSSVWFTYGYVHRDRVLMTTGVLWIVIQGSIALGISIYRA
jgi:hypothetical protein